MDSGPKNSQPQQPLFCLKLQLPWGDTATTTTSQNPKSSSSCNLEEPPWMFKSMQSISSLALNFLKNLSPKDKSLRGGNEDMIRGPEGQGEVEQRAFAAALASRKEATVLEFYSPKCRLCGSLVKFVEEVQGRNADWVSIVMADAENEADCSFSTMTSSMCPASCSWTRTGGHWPRQGSPAVAST